MPALKQLPLPFATVMSELSKENPVYGYNHTPVMNFAANSTPTPLPERMKNAGLKYFEYPDGFDCYALNKKNADKKHLRWQNEDAED